MDLEREFPCKCSECLEYRKLTAKAVKPLNKMNDFSLTSTDDTKRSHRKKEKAS